MIHKQQISCRVNSKPPGNYTDLQLLLILPLFLSLSLSLYLSIPKHSGLRKESNYFPPPCQSECMKENHVDDVTGQVTHLSLSFSPLPFSPSPIFILGRLTLVHFNRWRKLNQFLLVWMKNFCFASCLLQLCPFYTKLLCL